MLWRRLAAPARVCAGRALCTLPRWAAVEPSASLVASRWGSAPPAPPTLRAEGSPLGGGLPWWPALEEPLEDRPRRSLITPPAAWRSPSERTLLEEEAEQTPSAGLLLHPALGIALELPPAVEEAEVIQAVGKKGKRTYQPNVLKRKRTHGFMRRNSTKSGRRVLERRINKGRWKIAVT